MKLHLFKIPFPMNVHFDLTNQQCTVELDGETHVLDVHPMPDGPFWTSAIVRCVQIGASRYTFAWKTWMRLEQFVEVQEIDRTGPVPYKSVAAWSYIANPQRGTAQCRAIKQRGSAGHVRVTGSPFGDWSN